MSGTGTILTAEALIVGAADSRAREGQGVLVEGGRIAAIGPAATLAERAPGAARLHLAGCMLMPGLVNAHQHGRGLTQLQLGFPDMILEAWQTTKRRRGWLDPAAMVPLAAMQMLASGVTATIHANSTWGEAGRQPDDLARTIAAYDAAGVRALVGIGAQDRAGLVFPAEAQPGFVDGLPTALQALVGQADPPVFAATAAEAAALFDDLAARLPAHGRLRLAFAPAGPQWVSDALFAGLAQAARSRGAPIHLHALESVAQAAAARALYPEGTLARLERLGVLGPVTSLAHAAHLTPGDVAVAAATGTLLVRNPASNLRLGCGTAPLAAYWAAGVRVAVGTDCQTMDDDEDLWKELRLAARLATEPAWHGAGPADAETLLAMATGMGAAAMGLQGQVGALAPGLAADIIAVDLARVRGAYADPSVPLLDLLLARADARDVRLTMVDGRVLYREGRFPHLDPAAIAAAAAEAAARARAPWTPGREEAVAGLVAAVRDHYLAREV
ncbi:amidohydrolase family protein [Falsiroseomonas selenitidurans]|uniref:Amidohydrolase family protein n=1 Tax=Falsiroseomonas selenitidurans TaxID=2716335 RepID=A0ABX1DXY7_9PROT|nr:amidohydrolase family protein [Falsiroseomonas selenitidurans]NKC29733.1 amidohydrolase family protein [Falsiroseomonas selenitidurans]